MTKLLMTALLLTQTLPTGYWPLEKSQPIIDKTQTIRLSGDLSKLSEGERKAVAKLIEAGQIFQKLYEQQRHPEALASYRALVELDKRTGSTPATQNLLTLYHLNQGPIATTLENKREPFLPVDGLKPGKNVYPWGIKKEEVDQTRADLLDLRTVVRSATATNLKDDIAVLQKYPALQTLHPKLLGELQRLSQRGRCLIRLLVRLAGQRFEHQHLDQVAHPASCFCCAQQALQQANCLAGSLVENPDPA